MCSFSFSSAGCGNEAFMPVHCVSPSYFKEPQTEPLLGERIVLWPLFFCSAFSMSVSKEMYRFLRKLVPRSTRCCVTRLLVTVSERCVQLVCKLWRFWADKNPLSSLSTSTRNKLWTLHNTPLILMNEQKLVEDLIWQKVSELPEVDLAPQLGTSCLCDPYRLFNIQMTELCMSVHFRAELWARRTFHDVNIMQTA